VRYQGVIETASCGLVPATFGLSHEKVLFAHKDESADIEAVDAETIKGESN
jgi:hypothetical protein